MDKNAKAKAAAVARYQAAFNAANDKPCTLTEDYPGKFRIASTGRVNHLGYVGWRGLDKLSATLEQRVQMRQERQSC